ncbi:hypothetical protein M378DRAFT_158233 [Amanita muscaria Koide BX008]|uniref:Uncharacterized protein n=1 Tax=Amanita muscaria (strain Koide BX008) TaxID=946122 RepID=A0A0C2TMM6_AMAMK|nr:hypothetical protein M378DRAFT_158233 [Amanita muscaria Koide BX008]
MATVSLLEEFPSPPSHIPNPPPSLPPSLPLPPLPGPSPISDNFLRRSIASHRDSILFPPGYLDRSSISPYPLSDIGDDDDTLSAPNESISDIQLPLTDDDEDGSAHTATQASNLSTADLIDPVVLHLQIRAARSRSESHRQMLRAKSQSPSRSARHPRLSSPPPLPTKGGAPDLRSVSPDIPTILSKTPRPRKQHGTIFSQAQNSSRPMPRRVSDGDIALCHTRRPKTAVPSFASDQHVTFPAEIDKEALSDSDSSIDLRTPLPSLMVRHGLLSPRSKLLPTSFGTSHESRGSISSLASNSSAMTKYGILKDERDTPMRRHRHRDGRLLRGGIGLTTGLGWSDSEDEDAPSPLTRRLSSLSLARRASASSVQSAYTHPLSRSVSTNSRLLEEPEDDETYDVPVRQRCNTLSSSLRYPGKSSHPPISWQNRPPTTSRLSSTSSSAGSKDSCLSFLEQPERIHRSISESDGGFNDMLNTPSTGSSLSIPMPSTPSDEPKLRKSIGDKADKNKSLPPIPAPSLRKISSNISSTGIRPGTRPRTISSTSSVSSVTHSPPRYPLPPVPTAASGSTTPRPLKLPVQTRQSQSQPQTPTYRGGGVDRPAVPVPSVTPPTSGGLRPLSTSTSQPSLPKSPRSLPRLASRLPSKSPTTISAGSSPLPSPVAVSNPVSEVAPPKPRPRIGSGMVYRTSSYSGLDANVAAGSKLRAPKSLTLGSQPSSPTRSSSTSLPPRPGMLRTPMSIPRRVAS